MQVRLIEDTRWEARIARAQRLRRERPSAAEVLAFYASLAELQHSLLRRHPDVVAVQPPVRLPQDFARSINNDALLSAVPPLLAWLRRQPPGPVARAAEELHGKSNEDLWRLIETYLAAAGHDVDLDEPRLFIVEALLQPFAEAVAVSAGADGPVQPTVASRCPSCQGLPVVGVLREQGHGRRRSLVCGLCATEWPSLRLFCPSCGEERSDQLPVFQAQNGGVARVDACDTCRVYVKSIDLARDGDAVPVVDDLATLPLDLWAAGEGYEKLRPNLLRL
jgi:FdhE protein